MIYIQLAISRELRGREQIPSCKSAFPNQWNAVEDSLPLLPQGVHGQGKSQGKIFFSRSGNCQGILKFVREFWNLSKSQGKVREF